MCVDRSFKESISKGAKGSAGVKIISLGSLRGSVWGSVGRFVVYVGMYLQDLPSEECQGAKKSLL